MPWSPRAFVDGLTTHHILTAAIVGLAGLYLASIGIMGLFGKSKHDVRGKHCYITGGSSGLGRSLALSLVRRGAHVTIVARGQARLDEVAAELRAMAASPDVQVIQAISADLTSAQSSADALERTARAHGGRAADEVYLCAGMSRPQFFIEASADDLQSSLDGTYWVSAWTAHAAVKSMVAQKIKGRVVFVSSFLGYTSFAGYSPYSPGKYALRGLADALRSELLLHEISVHIFMPGGIDTPGYVDEQKLKPRITAKIEEDDVLSSADSVAGSLLSGIEKGYYQITNMLITDLVRLQSCGAVPGNSKLLDAIYWVIGGIGVPIWRMMTDARVRKEAPAVRAELAQRGYYL